MKKIQWNNFLKKSINIFIYKKNLVQISFVKKPFHLKNSNESSFSLNDTKKTDFAFSKSKILDKLNLINPKLQSQDFSQSLIEDSLEMNFPIWCNYQKLLLKKISDPRFNYLFDYKYCTSFIMNTIFFLMINTAKKCYDPNNSLINNMVIYVKILFF